jgi:hypothetical protein
MSDLWTSSTGVFLQGSVLGTFCGQAFGSGNKKLAGVWMQVLPCHPSLQFSRKLECWL